MEDADMAGVMTVTARDDKGASMVEYGLLVAGVAVFAVACVALLATSVGGLVSGMVF